MGSEKLFFLVLGFFLLQAPAFAIKKNYVVYFGAHSHGHDATLAHYELATEKHYTFLESFLGSKEKAKDSVIYSYQKHINGFAAKLEEEEALAISRHPDVMSIFPDKLKELHITRSWTFMGLERDGEIPAGSIWDRANFGRDSIIATLDTGVWPESECFKDDGMGPVPKRWKGSCQNNTNDGVPCNRKLIGAKYFSKGSAASGSTIDPGTMSARDFEGHGTHTLSTIGCRFVPGANAFNHANGTAKGGSPAARVAVYKVCWQGCFDSDILAGFDEAIHDGVDVLSVSLGSTQPIDYLQDGTAIGGFHAVMNGILVVCSAGNSGQTPGLLGNSAPWLTIVAASTLDRDFISYATLGNNQQLRGKSLSPGSLPEKMYPIIYAKDATASDGDPEHARVCLDSLDPAKAKGKILICDVGFNDNMEKTSLVKDAGGVGVILANDEETGDSITPEPHTLPATQISYDSSLKLFSYMNSTKSPVAYISFPQTVYGQKPNPKIAGFSSRGPNAITASILKPDVTAPGVQVLAAYTGFYNPGDRFVFMDGTSMSCPHVSGTVGLLKSLYPQWTTAAIRSAIMTTGTEIAGDFVFSATTLDNSGKPIIDSSTGEKANPFARGAGHIRPNSSMSPGLVYDISTDDYLNFMCASGYNSTQLDVLRKHHCPEKPISPLNLNYPSITIPALKQDPVTVTRKLKNVGPPGTYKARVETPRGVSVVVNPKTLTFERLGEEKSFELTLRLLGSLPDNDTFGQLIWSDGLHYVRSPISVSSA